VRMPEKAEQRGAGGRSWRQQVVRLTENAGGEVRLMGSEGMGRQQ
jgi:hypothetical protein